MKRFLAGLGLFMLVVATTAMAWASQSGGKPPCGPCPFCP